MIGAALFDVGGPFDAETWHEAAIDAGIRAGLGREGFAAGDAEYAAAERVFCDPRREVTDVLEVLEDRGLELGLAANQALAAPERLAAHRLGRDFANRGVSGAIESLLDGQGA